MMVSIVIAVERINDHVRDNIKHCLEMSFQDFEILIFVSEPTDEKFTKTRIIVRPDLAFNPAQRRDLAINEAGGEILAFIDDDAYPSKDWLKNALPYFEDSSVAAVGGPGVTPPEDNCRRQVSGWVSASPLGGGPSVTHRFMPSQKREVQDYPSMNLLVRKSDFAMVGGFDSGYWPGEDTKLCADLTLKIGKRIMYDPDVLVYHHRRNIFVEHLKQNGRYGFHRGYFAKTLPQTSRKPVYFFPSLFTVFLFSTPFMVLFLRIVNFQSLIVNPKNLISTYFLLLISYFLLLVFNAYWVYKRSKNYKVSLLTIPAIFLTHVWYGIQFIRGFFSPKPRR